MKCPYCGKCFRDIPDHLVATKACKERHLQKLKADLQGVLRAAMKARPSPAKREEE